jgi:hypothetical protein
MPTPTTYLIRNPRKSLPGYSLAVIGSVLALAGAGALAAFGFDGQLNYRPHLLSTPATAVVSSVASIKHTEGVTTVFGQPTLRITASPLQGTNRVFVGIGPAAQVGRYLAGVATQQSTNLDLQEAASTAVRHPGRATAQPPAAQSFWVARASSTRTAEVNWKIRDGRYRVVVMSADAHGGFAATTSIGVTIPNIPDYALPALLLGLLIAGGGTGLLIRANRQPRIGSIITDARSAVPASV